LAALCAFCSSYITAIIGVRAALKLHENLLERMIRGTCHFFDATPVGMIVTRFSAGTYDLVELV
jgi:ABC-type multidrug transport system fused ATPase/permease subunit